MSAASPRETEEAIGLTGAELATSTRALARMLERIGVVRSVLAFALGAYVFFQDPASAAAIARASGVYWVIDGVATLRTARFAELLATSRTVFLLRGAIAIAAGLVLLALPLGRMFGPWQPGQAFLFILIAPITLTVIGLQVGAGAFDVFISRGIRRRIRTEWSWAIAGAFSVVLAVLTAATFAMSAPVVARVVSVAAILAAFGFVVAAFAVGDVGAAAVVPAHPRKH